MSPKIVMHAVCSKVFGRLEATVASVTLSVIAVPIVLLFTSALPAYAQQPQAAPEVLPSFDVISIKPNRSGRDWSSSDFKHGRAQLSNTDVLDLVRFCYVEDSTQQVSGGPAWIKSDRYDIEATVDESRITALDKLDSKERNRQFRLMMRSLLRDRFKLAVDRTIKERPAYELVVAKGGPRFQESPDSTEKGSVAYGTYPGYLVMKKGTAEYLARRLRNETGRPVIDKTGLTGRYDMELHWTREKRPEGMSVDAGAADTAADFGPSIFTALQEQLGLKLVPTKTPVEEFVIKQIERPTEN